MPDRTITISVTYDEDLEPEWPEVPPIQMTGAGTITLQRARESQWRFSGFKFYAQGNPDTPTHPADFGEPTVSDDKIQITDNDHTRGRYFFVYQITRRFRPHVTHWSPDPEIDNDPPA